MTDGFFVVVAYVCSMGTTLPAHFYTGKWLPPQCLSAHKALIETRSLIFNFQFSILFPVAVLEHIAQYLDGESGFFDFEILAEMAKL